jgi:hypothetical protein
MSALLPEIEDGADALAPMRGIFLGVLAGTHFWGIVIIGFLVWRAHR